MVWLYRSPIPVRRKGVFYLFWFLSAVAACTTNLLPMNFFIKQLELKQFLVRIIICIVASNFWVCHSYIMQIRAILKNILCFKIRCLCNGAYLLYCLEGLGQRYSHRIIISVYARYVHIEESLISNSTGAHIWWYSNFFNIAGILQKVSESMWLTAKI